MAIVVRQVGAEALARYARVPIAFEVRTMLRVEPAQGGLGGLALREMPVVPAYVKDYDSYRGCGPLRWPERYDVRNWAFFLALEGGRLVGAATLAHATPGLQLLAERDDVAGLWDLRVQPDLRRQGIGTMLFARAADWARDHGCTQLKVETQNVNVPACRFYARQGCTLGLIDRYAYVRHPEVAHEAMLLWYLDL